ncbi:MAG TPA: cbb3-type cytochrome oxidase assembly protein CcoS [Brumimicrobium sp.]|nr:cbb3-type cytochrome oxidase assembly protein CcoS [Brumimicrobium sp.]
MGIIYFMLVISLLIAVFFLGAYIWATKDGQFDDDYTPSVRVLFDDEIKKEEQKTKKTTKDGNSEV